MKKIAFYLTLLTMGTSHTAQQSLTIEPSHTHVNAEKHPHLHRFLKTYDAPFAFYHAASQLAVEYPSCFDGMTKDTVLPLEKYKMYLKGPKISRVLNAQRLKNCIARHNLDRLSVAEKHLVKIKDQWVILAKVPQGKPIHTIDDQTTQQLITLAQETGFDDWGTGLDHRMTNWLQSDERLVCIDTEDLSFSASPKNKTVEAENSLMALLSWWGNLLSENQKSMIEKALEDTTNQTEKKLSLYDTPAIDFSKAALEFKTILNEGKK